jgi:hypothetical protein
MMRLELLESYDRGAAGPWAAGRSNWARGAMILKRRRRTRCRTELLHGYGYRELPI